MAQTNYTPISLYYSTTASQAPSAGNLVNGELAINITDGKLYYKDNGGVVQIIAGKGGAGVAAGSNTQVQFNNSGAFGASSSFTWDGTTLAATKFSGALNGTVGATTPSTGAFTTLDASGNVTLSGGTANGVLYLNGSKVATSGSALTFDGTNFGTSTSALYPLITVASSGNNAIFGFRLNNTGVGGIDWRIEQGRSAVGEFNISSPNVYGSSLYAINAAATAHYWSTTSGEQMRLTSTGLGIGTSSPAYKLDVHGADGVRARVVALSSGTSGLILSSSGATAYALKAGNGDSSFRIDQDGTDRITLASGGNVGIGTSSITSGYKLDVRGNIYSYVASGNVGVVVQTGTNANGALNALEGIGLGLNTDATNRNITFSINSAEKVRIDSSGNVGIGTTSPGRRLVVVGTGTGSYEMQVGGGSVGQSATLDVIANHDSIAFQVWDDNNLTTPKFIVQRAGNVGIGTTAPNRKLHVQSSAAAIQLYNASDNGGTGIFFAGSSSNKNWFIGNQYNVNDALEFTPSAAAGTTTVGSTPAMVIQSAGNVGIGTSTPGYKLHVQGSATEATDIFVKVSSSYSDGYDAGISLDNTFTGGRNYTIVSTNNSRGVLGGGKFAIIDKTAGYSTVRVIIDSSGNVGIGTTSPASKLHVAGQAMFTTSRTAPSSTASSVINIGADEFINFAWSTSYNANSDYHRIGKDRTYSSYALSYCSGGEDAATNIMHAFRVGGSTGTNSTALVILANGNVGIGTTTDSLPSGARLIVKDITANDGTDFIGIQYRGTAGGHQSGIKWFDFGGQVNASIVNILQNDGAGTQAAHLAFKTATGGTLTERVRITDGGNVGIGTTPSTGDKVEIAGPLRVHTGNDWDGIRIYADGANGYIQGLGDETGLRIRSQYGNILLADDRGNVGIGTSSPVGNLNVNTTGNTQVTISAGNTGLSRLVLPHGTSFFTSSTGDWPHSGF